jgi:ATP-dependent DNA helicase RecG
LKGIETHRLRELILQDLAVYREASRIEIHARIGPEIAAVKVRKAILSLVQEGIIRTEGEKRGRRYIMIKNPSYP